MALEAGDLSEGPEPSPDKSIEIDGLTWRYREYGNPNGRPFVVLGTTTLEGSEPLSLSLIGQIPDSLGFKDLQSNNPEAANDVAEKIKAMKGKYYVIAPALPGLGETTPLKRPSYDTLTEALHGFLQNMGLEKAIVFGSSGGGVVAIKFAARFPEDVAAIILQGTATRPEDMQSRAYQIKNFFTSGAIGDFVEKRRGAKEIVAQVLAPIVGKAGFESWKEILLAFGKADLSTQRTTIRDFGLDLCKEINKIKCPVLVIDGAEGKLLPIREIAESAARFHKKAPGDKRHFKIVFLPIGGAAGEHGHNIANTFPEGIAFWSDYVMGKMIPSKAEDH